MACKHWLTGKHARSEIPCPYCEVEQLRHVLEQLVDDMGVDGLCVCEASKIMAIEVLVVK